MKKIAVALLAVALIAGGAGSALSADSYTYEAKNGNVSFDHKMHQEKIGDCSKCHEGTPQAIEVDKAYGHSNCKDCHKEMSGPTKCNECHKK